MRWLNNQNPLVHRTPLKPTGMVLSLSALLFIFCMYEGEIPRRSIPPALNTTLSCAADCDFYHKFRNANMRGSVRMSDPGTEMSPLKPSEAGKAKAKMRASAVTRMRCHHTRPRGAPQNGQQVSGGLLLKGLAQMSHEQLGQDDHAVISTGAFRLFIIVLLNDVTALPVVCCSGARTKSLLF